MASDRCIFILFKGIKGPFKYYVCIFLPFSPHQPILYADVIISYDPPKKLHIFLKTHPLHFFHFTGEIRMYGSPLKTDILSRKNPQAQSGDPLAAWCHNAKIYIKNSGNKFFSDFWIT